MDRPISAILSNELVISIFSGFISLCIIFLECMNPIPSIIYLIYPDAVYSLNLFLGYFFNNLNSSPYVAYSKMSTTLDHS